MEKLNNPTVHAVVGILWRDATHLLICERPQGKPYAGYWEFPGGKIEPQESSLHALKRELHEELGITVKSAQFLHQHQHAYPDKNVVLDLWKITEFEGEPFGREFQQIKWTTFKEIEEMRIPLLDGNWPILGIIKNS